MRPPHRSHRSICTHAPSAPFLPVPVVLEARTTALATKLLVADASVPSIKSKMLSACPHPRSPTPSYGALPWRNHTLHRKDRKRNSLLFVLFALFALFAELIVVCKKAAGVLGSLPNCGPEPQRPSASGCQTTLVGTLRWISGDSPFSP